MVWLNSFAVVVAVGFSCESMNARAVGRAFLGVLDD